MTPQAPPQDLLTFHDYLGIASRRQWLIMSVAVLAVVAAVALALLQEPSHRAAAQVLVVNHSRDGQSVPPAQVAERAAETQAMLASTPHVARRALASAGLRHLPTRQFLRDSSVSVQPETDVLRFEVTHEDPSQAVRLAAAYAGAFVRYRAELNEALERAPRRASPDAGPRDGDLDEPQAPVVGAVVVDRPEDAEEIEPPLVRNAVAGAGIGLILGLLAAFVAHALDTRVTGERELAAVFGVPLLGRLPPPRRRLRRRNTLATLADPYGRTAAACRTVRSNLEFFNMERGAKTIMVTSAVRGEGSSTLAANLAIDLTRAGRSVVLVDADPVAPSLDRFFSPAPDGGLSDVGLGEASLDDALTRIDLPAVQSGARFDGGALHFMSAGTRPDAVVDLVDRGKLGGILRGIAEHVDVLLIDGPPLPGTPGATALAAVVDAVLVVTRLRYVRRSALLELRRLLDASGTEPLGLVIAGHGSDKEGLDGFTANAEAPAATPIAVGRRLER